MDRQKVILKYLFKKNCKTNFCDIKHLLTGWTTKEIVNTLSVLRQNNKIKLSPDSNFNGIGQKQLGIEQTLDTTIIKAVLLDEGEKYYDDSRQNIFSKWTSIIALIISLISLFVANN